jgi:hypothetical protein
MARWGPFADGCVGVNTTRLSDCSMNYGLMAALFGVLICGDAEVHGALGRARGRARGHNVARPGGGSASGGMSDGGAARGRWYSAMRYSCSRGGYTDAALCYGGGAHGGGGVAPARHI